MNCSENEVSDVAEVEVDDDFGNLQGPAYDEAVRLAVKHACERAVGLVSNQMWEESPNHDSKAALSHDLGRSSKQGGHSVPCRHAAPSSSHNALHDDAPTRPSSSTTHTGDPEARTRRLHFAETSRAGRETSPSGPSFSTMHHKMMLQ